MPFRFTGGDVPPDVDIPTDADLGVGGAQGLPDPSQSNIGDMLPSGIPGQFWVLTASEFGDDVPPQWELINLSKWQAEAMGLLQDELSSSSADAAAANATANRRITLDGAISALRGYNDAQVSADARRANAMSEARQLAGILVPKGTEFFPGLGPQGPLARAMESAGLPFGEPTRVVEKEFQPQALAQAPEVPPQVQDMLAGIRAV